MVNVWTPIIFFSLFSANHSELKLWILFPYLSVGNIQHTSTSRHNKQQPYTSIPLLLCVTSPTTNDNAERPSKSSRNGPWCLLCRTRRLGYVDFDAPVAPESGTRMVDGKIDMSILMLRYRQCRGQGWLMERLRELKMERLICRFWCSGRYESGKWICGKW